MTQDLQKLFGTTLGKIESPYNHNDRRCRIKFLCVKKWLKQRRACSYVSVDPDKGTLKLKRERISNLPLQHNGTRKLTFGIKISQSCSCSRKYNSTHVTINLFIFPINFGDQFLKTNKIEKLLFDIKQNHYFSSRREMAINFHRTMRTINEENNPHALKEMMASVKVDTLLEYTTNTIVKKYVTTRPGNNSQSHPN